MSHYWNAWTGLACRVIGHKERRLRVGERGDGSDRKQLRICDRCGRLRAVKARKAKGAK